MTTGRSRKASPNSVWSAEAAARTGANTLLAVSE
jgi:hypothetical protein